jgi:hypothetical protein
MPLVQLLECPIHKENHEQNVEMHNLLHKYRIEQQLTCSIQMKDRVRSAAKQEFVLFNRARLRVPY